MHQQEKEKIFRVGEKMYTLSWPILRNALDKESVKDMHCTDGVI